MTRLPKRRLTVTVDPELVDAANRAVAAGRSSSVSSWVSAALAEHARRDRMLEALGAAVAEYEAEFGEITAEEIAAQRRADRRDAMVVRPVPFAASTSGRSTRHSGAPPVSCSALRRDRT
jgi:Arc/MetJ-type ribon-helix-helix transcriptional regulator